MDDPIIKLTELFTKFPGIGHRQAKRFVMFLVKEDANYLKDLSSSILYLKNNVSECKECFLYFKSNGNPVCSFCNDDNNDRKKLMVVTKNADQESIASSKIYNGVYFILGGNALSGNKENNNGLFREKSFLERIQNGIKKDGLKEIILALSLNTEGEYTDAYLRRILTPLVEKHNLKIVSLGKGLSTGTELEYSDNETIKNAFMNRS